MPSTLQAQLVDITTLAVDAVVNAANSGLTAGGGVCGAIHRAAGPELERASRRLAPCPTGQARITPGFRLPARFVIHAVGPIWHGGENHEAADLASAYRSSIELATAQGLASIAFPAISTGIFGYPLDLATGTAVAAVREVLSEPGPIERVIFACFSPEVLAAYRHAGVVVSRPPRS
jgi:O-acetyl-ADP-ribose deacetylase